VETEEEEEEEREEEVDSALVIDDPDFDTATNHCRMYEQKYPEAEDLVLVQVKNVAEMGAYVSLLEYNGIEGMILLSELSRRRIRSIPKLIRIGRTEVVVVIRVDKEKGYIDLSKRRVSPEDIAKCENKYNASKTVHSIMRHVSETCRVPLIKLYKSFGWDLYKRFGHAHDAFKLIVQNPYLVLGQYEIDPKVKAALLKNIKRRMTPKPVKIRADLEVTCFGYEGIDAIKAALKAGEKESTPDMPVKIKLVAPPLFVMLTTALDAKAGVATLKKACDAVSQVIKSKGGDINIKTAARAVTERDDRALNILMETLEKQNLEISGDED
jgi:translation initiation factor 2 subunit 1